MWASEIKSLDYAPLRFPLIRMTKLRGHWNCATILPLTNDRATSC
jgi:hypothetical protein